MIIWPKVQIFQKKISQITHQIKIKQRRHTEHHKISPQQIFQETQPTCQKINK